ncbi:MAG: triose-phosphate isomerase [bacterium]
MNKQKIIIANWKCNPTTKKEARRIFNAIQYGVHNLENVEIIICPPFVYIPTIQQSNNPTIKIGAQDCHWENKGTFTGAVSPAMIKDLGCKYVILGHSERRAFFSETDEIINRKIKMVLKNGLKPILCVGEKERDDKEMSLVVGDQLKKSLEDISKNKIKDIIIAYEPVWAISKGQIGSGKPCLPEDAVKANLFIRKTLANLYSRAVAEKVAIIYGGSVSSQNAVDYLKEDQINGALVGGASLIVDDFIKIVKNVEEL